MALNIDQLLPTAQQIQKLAATQEAVKAEEHAQRLAAVEAEKRALIERLSKPSGLSEDEKVKLASTVIQRAVRAIHRPPPHPTSPGFAGGLAGASLSPSSA